MTAVFIVAFLIGAPVGAIYSFIQFRRALARARDSYADDREKYLKKIRDLGDAIAEMKNHKTHEKWEDRPMDVKSALGNSQTFNWTLEKVDEF